MWIRVYNKRLNRILENSPQVHNDILLVSLTFSALTEMQSHAMSFRDHFIFKLCRPSIYWKNLQKNKNLPLTVTLSLSLLLKHLFSLMISLTKKFTAAVIFCKIFSESFEWKKREKVSFWPNLCMHCLLGVKGIWRHLAFSINNHHRYCALI